MSTTPKMASVKGGHKPFATALALLLSIGLVACGGGDSTSSATSTASTAPSSGAQGYKGGEASIEEFGAEASGSGRDEILGVFDGYLNAVAEGDYEVACSHLAETARGSLEQIAAGSLKGKGCAAILPKLLSPTAPRIARAQADGAVTRVRVEGDRAFVVFHAPGAKLYELTMVREGGEWRAATVTAAVLVPDL